MRSGGPLTPDQPFPDDQWGRHWGDPDYGKAPAGSPPIDGGGGDPTQQTHPPDPWGRPWGDPDYGVPPVGPGHTEGQPTPPPPPPGGGGNGGGYSLGSLAAYSGSMRPSFDISAAPAFHGPTLQAPPPFAYDPWNEPAPFTAPTIQDAQNEPGYAMARDEGLQAIDNAAGARGATRTGGTLKNLATWAGQFAQRNYGNVYDRKAGEFDRNRGNLWNAYMGTEGLKANAYQTNFGVTRDVFDRQYQGAKDTFAPTLLDWSTRAQAGQRAAEIESQRQYDLYTYGQTDARLRQQWQGDDLYRREKDVFDRAAGN
jgi:hypothetical protein